MGWDIQGSSLRYQQLLDQQRREQLLDQQRREQLLDQQRLQQLLDQQRHQQLLDQQRHQQHREQLLDQQRHQQLLDQQRRQQLLDQQCLQQLLDQQRRQQLPQHSPNRLDQQRHLHPSTTTAATTSSTEQQSDAALIISDEFTKTRYKFSSASGCDKQQMGSVYIACRGIPQEASTSSKAEDGDGDSSSSCVICSEAPVEAACIPCGHMAFCMSCLAEIKTKKGDCPVCRAKIIQVIRIYAV